MKVTVDLNSKDTTHNKDIMLEVVKKDETFFDYASDELKNNYSFNLEAVRANPKVYYYINAEFKNDRDIVLLAANPKKNKFIIGMHIRDELAYYNINEKLRDDEEVMLKAIQVANYNFEYASDRLKKDKKFCLKALKLGARFKDVGLFEDDDLVFKAAKNGDIPNHLYPKRYSQNKEYIKLIVSGTDNKNGTNNTMNALWYLSDIKSKYLNDKEIAKLALKRTSQAFQVINKKFRKDEDLILVSLKSDYNPHRTLEYADKKFRNNKKFLEKAISYHGESLTFANKKFIKDRNLVFKALNNGLFTIDDKFKTYSKDEEFIKKVIYENENYDFYKYIDNKYKKDFDLTKKILKNHYRYFKHFNNKYKDNDEIIFLLLTEHFHCLQDHYEDYEEETFTKNDLKYINKRLSNREFIVKILKKLSENNNTDWVLWFKDQDGNSLVWKHFNKKLKKDKSFVLELAKINVDYRHLFKMNDFYKNKKYDPDIEKLFMDNNPNIRMRGDGEIIVKDNEDLKFEIELDDKYINQSKKNKLN